METRSLGLFVLFFGRFYRCQLCPFLGKKAYDQPYLVLVRFFGQFPLQVLDIEASHELIQSELSFLPSEANSSPSRGCSPNDKLMKGCFG